MLIINCCKFLLAFPPWPLSCPALNPLGVSVSVAYLFFVDRRV